MGTRKSQAGYGRVMSIAVTPANRRDVGYALIEFQTKNEQPLKPGR